MRRQVLDLAQFLGRPAKAVAEVGVYAGAGARHLRALFPAAHLYLIDPWAPNHITRTYEIDNSPEKWAGVERQCRRRFRRDRAVTFLKMHSHEAVPRFDNGSLDVIFLDAGREYALLAGYIGAWLPKLAPGGIMAGKGLAGAMRGDVRLALEDRFPGYWVRVGRGASTTWAAKP